MSAADTRLAELLDRWTASIELHSRYLALDDAAYAAVQDWPRHQRPTRWVLELARQRIVELNQLLTERRSHGDAGFAEALELMALLTTLLGTEHVERFIPMALPKSPDRVGRAAPPPPPAEMAATTPAPGPAARRSAALKPDPVETTVIMDAVRLLSWGREWPQLAGLIARLANRPQEDEVWKILRRHRGDIQAKARRPRG